MRGGIKTGEVTQRQCRKLIISGLNDGDDDSQNEEVWFGGGQSCASSMLRLWDRCKMRNENRHEAETTAEQPCGRSNQITQNSDSNPSQFVLALSFKCPHDSLT